jgi:hypothetical protein
MLSQLEPVDRDFDSDWISAKSLAEFAWNPNTES